MLDLNPFDTPTQPKSQQKSVPASLSLFGPIDEYPSDPKKAAKTLMERGLKVIPFRVNGKIKTPMIRTWSPYHYSWNMIEREIGQAFGIVVPKGLIVIDLDCDQGGKYVGLDAIGDLALDCGITGFDYLDTLITDTPSGGMHLWYRVPPNIRVKNSASRIAPNIDVRVAEKGLVLMPPSRNSDGMPYIFSGTGKVSKLPTWLLSQINESTIDANKVGAAIRQIDTKLLVQNRDVARYLSHRCSAISDTPFGARNNTLNAVAYSVYRRVAGGLLDEYSANMAIENAAMIAGLGEAETAATMRSAMEAALLRPISSSGTY